MKKRAPTIRDVAKRAGVSPITVSRTINNSGYISAKTRLRVEEAIAALDYVPNSLSQSLRFKKTNTIALLISDVTNPFWTTITRGVEDVSNAQGLNVILCNTDEQPSKLQSYVNLLLQRQIDGILLAPSEEDTAIIRKIQKLHVPLVLLDRTISGVQVDAVRSDSEGGAFQLTQYLIDIGHRRIAMLTGPASISTSRQRAEGYRRALLENGLPIDESIIVEGGYKPESGHRMALEVMKHRQPRPTALFAGNNFIALGIFQALGELGLRTPEDVSVVSFDELPIMPYQKPFLTVAAQSPYHLGQRAAELLLDLISGKEKADNRDIVLPVEIIIRESCRAITP